MVWNFVNWCWIFVSTYLTGWAISKLLEKVLKCPLRNAVTRLAIGLALVNVYAEFFSLVYKVGIAATLGLAVFCFLSLVIVRNDVKVTLQKFQTGLRKTPSWKILTGCAISVFFLMISASKPYLGDTYMYHIQAVKWIEQYGVVKGLGNLHFRFAYNSAFECLAALYSWSSWGPGLSLHAVNGFYAALMVNYCVLTFRWRPRGKWNKIFVSDLLKIATVIYIFGRLLSYGSADTDPLVIHCIAFIFIRWFEILENRRSSQSGNKEFYFSESQSCLENEEKDSGSSGKNIVTADDRGQIHNDTAYFALLAVFGVYACTVKLSAGPVIVLALYPLIHLICEKRGKLILLFLLIGALIAVPWLTRNVIISGYLIYPVTSIDLFNVDWKMPKSIIQIDRDGIISWGRSIQYENDPMSMSVRQWLPIWFSSLTAQGQILFVFAVLACIVFVVHMVRTVIQWFSGGHKVKESFCAVDFVIFVSLVCFLFWMSSAPLLRYGELYLWLAVIAVFGSYFDTYPFLLSAMGISLCAEILSVPSMNLDSVGLFLPADYEETFGMDLHETGLFYEDGSPVVIYTPDENAGAQSDYWYFPETPEKGQLEALEYRGNSLEDGFRSLLRK